MSAISIFIEIDFQGNTYYLSNSAVTREQVFYPYLTSVPSLSIGGEGYAVVTTGGLSIIKSDDATHPFSGDRYYSLIEKAQEVPFRIYIEDEDAPVFIGNIALDKVGEDEFNFLILEEDFEKKLVTPVISKASGSRWVEYWYLYREFGSTELRLMLTGFYIGGEFNNMDEVIIEKTYKHIGEKYEVTPFEKLNYDDEADNKYFISDSKAKRVMLVDKDDNSQYITTDNLLNYYNEKDATLYFPTETDLLSELGVDLSSPLPTTYVKQYVDSDGNTVRPLGENTYNSLMFFDDNENALGELFEIANQPTSEFWVGVPNPNPFTFGRVKMRDPVVVFGERMIKSTYLNYNPQPPDTTPVSASATTDYNRDFIIVPEVTGVQGVPSRNVRVTSANANQLEPNFYPSNQNNSDGRRIWLKAGNNPWDNPYYSAASGYTNESSAQPIQNGSEIAQNQSYSGPVTQSNYTEWGNKYQQTGGSYEDRSVTFINFNNGTYVSPTMSSSSLGVTGLHFYTRTGGGTTIVQGHTEGPHGPLGDKQAIIFLSRISGGTTAFQYKFVPNTMWITKLYPITGRGTVDFHMEGTHVGQWTGLISEAQSLTQGVSSGRTFNRGTQRSISNYRTAEAPAYDKQTDYYRVTTGSGYFQIEVKIDGVVIFSRTGTSNFGGGTSGYQLTVGSTIGFQRTKAYNFDIHTIDRFGLYGPNNPNGILEQEREVVYNPPAFGGGTYTIIWYKPDIVFKNAYSHYEINENLPDSVSTTGTLQFYWNGNAVHTMNSASVHTDYSTTKIENGRTVIYTALGSSSNRASNGTLSWIYPIKREFQSTSVPNPFVYSAVYDSWSKAAVWSYSDTYSWTKEVIGVPSVPEYTYEKSRERIYSRNNDLYDDTAWGVGWAKDRNFSSANAGYYISQIIVDSGVVSESENKIKVTFSGSSFVTNVENAGQKLTFASINNGTDAAGNTVNSDLYRIYRTDSKKEDDEIGIVRINNNKPTITKLPNQLAYVIENLNLSYDSNPNSATISLRCYAGAKIKTIAYEDGSNPASSTGWMNENGVSSGYVDSYDKQGIPSGTQKITITIDHDPNHTFDSYSNNNYGVDIEIHQRILPEIGSTAGFTTIHALIGSFEIFICNDRTWERSYDLIDYGFKQAGDLEFDEVTGELAVNTIRNPNLNVTTQDYPVKIFDSGYPLESDADAGAVNPIVLLSYSDEEFINVRTTAFGQYAISGESIFGKTVGEFFQNVVCKKLNEEDEKVELTPDLTRAPYSSSSIEPFNNLPIFQDSEITVIEMARTVATNTNHIFFFRYKYDSSSDKLSRELVLVDLNYVFNEVDPDKNIAESQIVNIDTDYPYPAKAFESTLTRNVAYIASDENHTQPTNMKSESSKYRVEGSGVGKVQSVEVFAETFAEGRKWMRRLAETLQLPVCSVSYEGIDREISLGSKVSLTDYMRKLDIQIVVQSMSYNFDQETTSIEGIGKFDEITYRR